MEKKPAQVLVFHQDMISLFDLFVEKQKFLGRKKTESYDNKHKVYLWILKFLFVCLSFVFACWSRWNDKNPFRAPKVESENIFEREFFFKACHWFSIKQLSGANDSRWPLHCHSARPPIFLIRTSESRRAEGEKPAFFHIHTYLGCVSH